MFLNRRSSFCCHSREQLFPNVNSDAPDKARFVMLGMIRATWQGISVSNCDGDMGLVIETKQSSSEKWSAYFCRIGYMSIGFTQMKISWDCSITSWIVLAI
ncbi:hypothetical protein BACI71_110392 [Bacillus mycoides]|uniref:Uncharacterized protein n=1 Tax=Bacillus mycoides TaxID=1405 RepID=A0A653QDR4_BACMY|nr:hypothetical protein BACI71_110392 [Bacillus mycoides]